LSHPYRPIHRQHLHHFSTAATFRPFKLSPSRLFSLFLLAWGQSKCLKQSPAQDFPSLLGTRMGTTSIRPPHGRSPPILNPKRPSLPRVKCQHLQPGLLLRTLTYAKNNSYVSSPHLPTRRRQL
jgi:hypothetical protein